jgi:hypothetical protein
MKKNNEPDIEILNAEIAILVMIQPRNRADHQLVLYRQNNFMAEESVLNLVGTEVMRLLEDQALIEAELNRDLAATKSAEPFTVIMGDRPASTRILVAGKQGVGHRHRAAPAALM